MEGYTAGRASDLHVFKRVDCNERSQMRGTYKATLEHKPTAEFLNKGIAMRTWICHLSWALFSLVEIKWIVEAISTKDSSLY